MFPTFARSAALVLLTMLVACATTSSPTTDNATAKARLEVQVFNPGADSLFPVTSTLVLGPTEAVLIDAQFQRNDAQAVLKMIQDSGRTLKTVYISHGDPDFYFGLDVIRDAYPNVSVVASAPTIAHIQSTLQTKLKYWGPILGQNAPSRAIVPDLLTSPTLYVDGQPLEVVGLEGHDPKHTFVWAPSIKTILGGVVLFENMHVWMADSKTPTSRAKLLKTLDQMLALGPHKIIPGHFLGQSPMDEGSVRHTRAYIQRFEKEASAAASSTELIDAMKRAYPDFTNTKTLELSAKVVKGEMPWP